MSLLICIKKLITLCSAHSRTLQQMSLQAARWTANERNWRLKLLNGANELRLCLCQSIVFIHWALFCTFLKFSITVLGHGLTVFTHPTCPVVSGSPGSVTISTISLPPLLFQCPLSLSSLRSVFTLIRRDRCVSARSTSNRRNCFSYGMSAADWTWIVEEQQGWLARVRFACWTILTPVSPPSLEAGPDPLYCQSRWWAEKKRVGEIMDWIRVGDFSPLSQHRNHKLVLEINTIDLFYCIFGL